MKKILVLCRNYPNNDGGISLMYIHTRNIEYINNGYEVIVLNFSAKKSYTIDNIKVITIDEYNIDHIDYDLLICHAANIRNHFSFLRKYEKKFKKIVFFFHGHEVLMINKVYSKPYYYFNSNIIKKSFQNLYDLFKLSVWRRYLPKIMYKTDLIFVSNWMKNEFEKWVMTLDKYSNRVHITYNGIGKIFENKKHCITELKYDFVTIRAYLDGSKYCVDLVIKLAKKFPDYKFCVVGKGDIFNHYVKPDNLIWINKQMHHSEIIEILNKSRCALMPTRTDAQGLMSCEMASFGIPLITSNIDVCHEIFDEFDNVGYIDNENPYKNFDEIVQDLLKREIIKNNTKYYTKNTIQKELEVFNDILGENK